MAAIFFVEAINFVLGVAIFVAGYWSSSKFFADDATVLKKAKFNLFLNAIRWTAVSFLLLALHEFVTIVSDLNWFAFDFTIPYLATEALFFVAVVGAASAFVSAVSDPAFEAVD